MEQLKTHLCQAVRRHVLGQTGAVPEAGRHLFGIFASLSQARSWGERGPGAIGYQEIEAWARLMRVPLRPSDVTIIRAMDEAFLAAWYDKKDMGQAEGVKTLPPVSQHPLSAALFDAVIG